MHWFICNTNLVQWDSIYTLRMAGYGLASTIYICIGRLYERYMSVCVMYSLYTFFSHVYASKSLIFRSRYSLCVLFDRPYHPGQ